MLRKTGFKPPTKEKLKELQEKKYAKAISKRASTSRFKAPQKRNTLGIKKTRKTTKASAVRRKKGIWATSTADSYFSKWIRERDGECRRCKRTDQLTCSHYHKRAISITRFDPNNCIALCGECHALWEGPKEDYTTLMIEWLGAEGFIELQKRAGRMMKRSDAVFECKKLIKECQ